MINKIVAAKIPKPDADTFEKKVGKKNMSKVIRALVQMFNRGEVKVVITETIGG